jgi:hypothetical protein
MKTLSAGRGLESGDRKRLRLGDFAAAQTAGAHAHTLAAALDLGVDGPQIDVPAATRHIVGVTDVVARHWAFTANLTNLCHD